MYIDFLNKFYIIKIWNKNMTEFYEYIEKRDKRKISNSLKAQNYKIF